VALDEGQFTIVAATYSVERLKGTIRKHKITVSIEDMNCAVDGRVTREGITFT
jgi:hypothetical protein